MTRRVLLLIAAAAALGAGAATYAVLPEPQPVTSPGLALPSLAANYAAADRIEITHAGRDLWLERRGQVWGLAGEGGYPVERSAAESLTAGLLTMRFLQPAGTDPGAAGLADPHGPSANSGTLIRVLSTSGAVLGAIIVSEKPGNLVRRPGEDTVWQASTHVHGSVDPADWNTGRLPPIAAFMAKDASMPAILADLAFTDVRAAPQVHPPVTHTLRLTLRDGTADLATGLLDGTPWLHVTGTSAWAAALTPYAFALPADSKLAALANSE